MEIIINGQSRRLSGELTVAALLEELELGNKRIAVERNGELVPRSQHDKVQLTGGDRIEIVQAIGGG